MGPPLAAEAAKPKQAGRSGGGPATILEKVQEKDVGAEEEIFAVETDVQAEPVNATMAAKAAAYTSFMQATTGRRGWKMAPPATMAAAETAGRRRCPKNDGRHHVGTVGFVQRIF